MNNKDKDKASVFFLFAVALLSCCVPAMADPSVSQLTLISEVRVGRTVFDLTYKVTVQNDSTGRTGVTATLQQVGQGTAIRDGVSLVGDLAANATVSPNDTITVRHDRLYPFSQAAFVWSFSGGIAAGLPASASIGPAGGAIGLPDGTRLDVPPGALVGPVTLSVREVSPTGALPPNGVFAGKVYEFSPSGQTFAVPVIMTFPYDPSILPPGLSDEHIAIYVELGDGVFSMVGGESLTDPEPESHMQSIDTASKKISVNRTSFSKLGPIAVKYVAQFSPTSLNDVPGTRIDIQRRLAGFKASKPTYHKCEYVVTGLDGKETTEKEKPPTFSVLPDRPIGIEAILLHSTNNSNYMNPFDQELGWAINRCNKYFAHYYIDRTGLIFQVADEMKVADHTRNGVYSSDDSIGIELHNNVGEPYDGRQIASLIRLMDYLTMKHNIARPQRDPATGLLKRNVENDRIITHSENLEAKCHADVVAGVKPKDRRCKCPVVNGQQLKCDPIGTFQSSSSRTFIPKQFANAQSKLIQGGIDGPSLIDAVVDALAVLDRSRQHTGVINTSGGDGGPSGSPGEGGSVSIREDVPAVAAVLGEDEMASESDNTPLLVNEGSNETLKPGMSYTDAIIAGTLVIDSNSPSPLPITGTVYLAPTGKILLNSALDGVALNLFTRGTPILQGLVDASGANAATDNGGRGGTVEITTANASILAVPTIITRGGDSATAASTGGAGGNVTIATTDGHLVFGGGVGPGTPRKPEIRDKLDPVTAATYAPPTYVGDSLPPPPPFNVGTGGVLPIAGQRLPALRLPGQIGFTRGILTSGGTGGFGSPMGGLGGAGGDIVVTIGEKGLITFRDIDLVTGADVESIFARIFLSDGAQHQYCAPTGSLGGKGSSIGFRGADGGGGGAAGSITFPTSDHYDSIPLDSTLIASIPGYGLLPPLNVPLVPLITDINVNCAAPIRSSIGEVRQIKGQGAEKLYRVRLTEKGTLAGGSGGIPGGRPLPGQFPGFFGVQGEPGRVIGLPLPQ